MSFSNAAKIAILDHFFSNLAIANFGDATGLPGSAVAGNLYLSLYTADPGAAATQATNEAAYAGYARLAVSRVGGFVRTSTTVSPAANQEFAEMAQLSPDILYWGIGTQASGAGLLLLYGALPSAINAANQAVIPRIKSTSTITLT